MVTPEDVRSVQRLLGFVKLREFLLSLASRGVSRVGTGILHHTGVNNPLFLLMVLMFPPFKLAFIL